MAEFRKLPTQAELQNMLFMEQMRVKNPQQIAQEALASGTTVSPIPENVFQKIAGGAGIAKEYVNRAGSAADLAKLFPGYKPETRVNIPTGYNFAPKQAPTGEIIPGGLQTQNVNLGQVLGAIKPADVLGISGAERAYSDIGAGKAPQPLDVLDVAGLGATGLVGGKAALRATKGVPVGMSIQEAKGLLTEAPRSPLGFYSALEESALNLQRNKGSGQAFLNDLQKAPNVKADEIKWTGLDEFLKTKQNVTKQEVQDYLANNRVDVKEVVLSDAELTKKLSANSTKDQNLYDVVDENNNIVFTGNEYDADLFIDKSEAKFGKYTLFDGNNYREILLTMPARERVVETQIPAAGQKPVIFDAGNGNFELLDEMGEPFAFYKTRQEAEKAADDWAAPFIKKETVKDKEYFSTHFNEPNILAHLRVNDRVDADGKKMLLVEEVQSDWHQAGREKGYMTPPKIETYQPKNLQINYSDFFEMGDVTGDNGRVLGKVNKQPNGKFKSEILLEPRKIKDLGQFATKEEAFDAIKNQKLYTHRKSGGLDIGEYDALFLSKEDALSSAKLSGVPDAPFKDSWYQLALKRAIQYAAENGYDRIGLTTGSQQAARFDLSKQVGLLSGMKQKDGNYVVYLEGKDGSPLFRGQNGFSENGQKVMSADELANTVGKEAAKKIIEGKPNKDGWVDLRDDALKVGGEGMKKYYDEIYPKFLDKYGKKWGARVGETKVNANGIQEPIRYLDVTPEMKASVSKGQPLFQALPAIPATGLLATQDEER